MLLYLSMGCWDASKPDVADTGESVDTDTVDTDTADADTADTDTADTSDTVPDVWEGTAGEGIGWGLLVGDDLDGAGTPGVLVAARGVGAVQLRAADGAVSHSIALDGAVWLQHGGGGGIAAMASRAEEADVYVLDGPLVDVADAEADARAIVRGLLAGNVEHGLGEGRGDATGDGAYDFLAMDGWNVRLFDGGALAGEHLPADAVATVHGDSSPVVSRLADLDADGIADVVVSLGFVGGASVFRGPVTGALAHADADLRVVGDACLAVLVAGDVDGDGRPELGCDVDLTDVALFPAADNGEVGIDDAVARVSPGGELAGAASLDADLDGDGRVELVLGEPTHGDRAGRFGVLHGPILGTFGPPDWLAVGPPDTLLGMTLAAGDVDGDGLGDVVAGGRVADEWAGSVYVAFGGR